MNCAFCQQELTVWSFNPEDGREQTVLEPPGATPKLKCKPCNTTYYLNQERLSCYVFTYQKYAFFFVPYQPDIKFRILDINTMSSVLALEHLPNINPQNIKDKLPTLLTFS